VKYVMHFVLCGMAYWNLFTPERERERERVGEKAREIDRVSWYKRGIRMSHNKVEVGTFPPAANCFLANDKIHFYAKANVRVCVCIWCVGGCVELGGWLRVGQMLETEPLICALELKVPQFMPRIYIYIYIFHMYICISNIYIF